MAASTPDTIEPVSDPESSEPDARLLPFSIAILVCLLISVTAAFVLWNLQSRNQAVLKPQNTISDRTPRLVMSATPLPVRSEAPAGELPVAGGVIISGGEEAGLPVRKLSVEPFAIAETEVTNEQYQIFVRESGHPAPPHWEGGNYLPGTASEPATMVTWQDAVAYCKWLSGRIGAEVRLPSEAEWELAAQGSDRRRYPWGNEWDDRAAESLESSGKIRAVRSFPAGRAPCGAYEMAGNVWEWVGDEAIDEHGEPLTKDGVSLRIAKGGSASEEKEFISTQSRSVLTPGVPRQFLGFRYVVIRRAEPQSGISRAGRAALLPAPHASATP